MLTFFNIIRIIVFSVVVPLLIGSLISTSYKKKYCGIAESVAYGFMLICLMFFILAVPMIFLRVHFHILVNTWAVAITVLSVISLYMLVKNKGYKEYAESIRSIWKGISADSFTAAIWIAAAFVILFEAVLPTVTMHVDTDDSRFVAEALEAVEKDTMLQYHAITGKYIGIAPGEQSKDVTSPYPLFIALLSKLYGLHPAITAHSVLPFLLIILSYEVFNMIGDLLTGHDIKKRGLFMFFLGIIHLLSFETIYASGYTLLTIIWQGRSVCAMIMLPFLWYILMCITAKAKITIGDYLMIVLSALGNTMTSNMGSILAPCMIASYAFVRMVRIKKVVPCILMCLCMIPSFACILVTRIMRTFLERL